MSDALKAVVFVVDHLFKPNLSMLLVYDGSAVFRTGVSFIETEMSPVW